MVDVAASADDREDAAAIEEFSLQEDRAEDFIHFCKSLLYVNSANGRMEGDDSPIGQACETCPEGILLMRDIATLLQCNGGTALIVEWG